MAYPEIRHVAVVGAGQMGAGIAQVAAMHDYTVSLSDISLEIAEKAVRGIEARLERLVHKGQLEGAAKDRTLNNLRATTLEAQRDGELVIEAASENLDLKLELFKQLSQQVSPETLLASNTSSISITKIASVVAAPERVVGLHFMNPVPLMKLVEIIAGLQTDPKVVERAQAFARALQKTTIVSKDRPGFIVNRILIPFLNEACFALEEGVGDASAIDEGARLGLNHPLGPLQLADLIGLDTVLSIAEVLHRELGDDKYRPAPLLRNLVAAGWLGRKSRRGFYVYDESGQATPTSVG